VTSPTQKLVTLADGRVIETWTVGEGPLVVWQTGTPVGPVVTDDAVDLAAAANVRLLLVARPGYGASTRREDRRVADVVGDIDAAVTAWGEDTYSTSGWSGGGPHALACAALSERCRSAAVIAGVAPYGMPGLDYLAGMGPENVDEFTAALAGRATIEAFLAPQVAELATVSADDLVAALGGLLPPVDADLLVSGYAEGMSAAFRASVASGDAGWVDDDLAFVAEWGFDLGSISTPVAIWQGSEDLMVPAAHGDALAAAIPGAVLNRMPGHGHLSLVASEGPRMLAELLAAAAH
jgi:pimeloyl-ACP methyl ester carboxylesterase